MYETHLTIVGTLITNVNRRHLTDDLTVAHFRVASNERRFDRDTGGWVDGDTLYVSVTCWRQLAENVHTSFTVGDPIIVSGRLYSRSYEDRDGKRQTVVELAAAAVGPDLSRATARITRQRRDAAGRDGAGGPATAAVAGGAGQEAPVGDRPVGGGGADTDDPWSGHIRTGADPFTDADEPTPREPAAVEAAVGA